LYGASIFFADIRYHKRDIVSAILLPLEKKKRQFNVYKRL